MASLVSGTIVSSGSGLPDRLLVLFPNRSREPSPPSPRKLTVSRGYGVEPPWSMELTVQDARGVTPKDVLTMAGGGWPVYTLSLRRLHFPNLRRLDDPTPNAPRGTTPDDSAGAAAGPRGVGLDEHGHCRHHDGRTAAK